MSKRKMVARKDRVIFFVLLLIYVNSPTGSALSSSDPPITVNLSSLNQEKVNQSSISGTYSNITLPQLRSNFSNATLDQEQTKELETDREAILYNCVTRIHMKELPGKLCDAFADYLLGKCKRFDNLLKYCGRGPFTDYESIRNTQISCMYVPPDYNDTNRIKTCFAVTPLNDSYATLPPLLSVSVIDKSYSFVKLQFNAENPGYSPIIFENLEFTLFQDGRNLTSGCVGGPIGCIVPDNYEIKPFSKNSYEITSVVDDTKNQGLKDSPLFFKGEYFYHFPQSKTNQKYFIFNLNSGSQN